MELLTTSGAAKVLGLSAKRVRELALSGRLRGRRLGRDWVFEADDVRAFARLERPPGWKKGRPRKK